MATRDLSMRYISRVDNENRGTHGWIVRVPNVRSKFVSDRSNDTKRVSKHTALARAKKVRNHLLRLHVAKIIED